ARADPRGLGSVRLVGHLARDGRPGSELSRRRGERHRWLPGAALDGRLESRGTPSRTHRARSFLSPRVRPKAPPGSASEPDPRESPCQLVRSPNTYSSPAASSRRSARADRKSTRLNSSHVKISYAVFCLKKKTNMSVSNTILP